MTIKLSAPEGLDTGYTGYSAIEGQPAILTTRTDGATVSFQTTDGADPNAILDRILYFAPNGQANVDYDVTATVTYSDDNYRSNVVTSQPIVIHFDDTEGQPAAPALVPEPEQGAAPVPQPAPAPEPEPVLAANFAIDNNGVASRVAGVTYAGPVAGLNYELAMITADSVAISAIAPNAFIVTGSGNDAISVAGSGGRNVLDGGTGSNFLTGGGGADTFFLDNRGPASATWSTIVDFKSGDAATVWGLTPQDFVMSWADGQGAAGHEGLTLHAAAAGRPDASLTLGGYNTADLSNGRLAMTFGHNGGGDYLYIHAV